MALQIKTMSDAYINSVKRLSDGEVFTIGDKVTFRNINSVIKDFRLEIEGLYVDFKSGNGISIKYVEKTKQPLFTTEDGVDVYPNDKYYFYNFEDEDCIEPYSDYAEDKDNRRLWLKFKTFHNKEAAKRYYIINCCNDIKRFTLKEILDNLTCNNVDELRENFIKLELNEYNNTNN